MLGEEDKNKCEEMCCSEQDELDRTREKAPAQTATCLKDLSLEAAQKIDRLQRSQARHVSKGSHPLRTLPGNLDKSEAT